MNQAVRSLLTLHIVKPPGQVGRVPDFVFGDEAIIFLFGVISVYTCTVFRAKATTSSMTDEWLVCYCFLSKIFLALATASAK